VFDGTLEAISKYGICFFGGRFCEQNKAYLNLALRDCSSEAAPHGDVTCIADGKETLLAYDPESGGSCAQTAAALNRMINELTGRDETIVCFAGYFVDTSECDAAKNSLNRATDGYLNKEWQGCSTTTQTTTPTTSQSTSPTTTPSKSTTRTTYSCKGHPVDLVFLLDMSGSVSVTNFEEVKKFAKAIVSEFDVGTADHQTRVGAVSFSSSTTLNFRLNQHQSNAAALNAIDGIGYQGGGTCTSAGLTAVRDQTFHTSAGMRADSKNVPRVLIVFTDGVANGNCSPISAAAQLQGDGVKIFSVGVGAGITGNPAAQSELLGIASDPDDEHYIELESFALFSSIVDQITLLTCLTTTSTTSTTTTSTTSTTTTPTTTTTTTPAPPCNQQIDLIFVNDQSGSTCGTVPLSTSSSSKYLP
jgi:hypothetical protein